MVHPVEFKPAGVIQQEKNTENDKNEGAHWCWVPCSLHISHYWSQGDSARRSRAGRHRGNPRRLPSKYAFKAKWIRHRLSKFNGVRCLISVEDRIEEIGKEHRHHNWAVFIRHPN